MKRRCHTGATVIILLLLTLAVFVPRPANADGWPPREKRTRQMLVHLAARYEDGLRGLQGTQSTLRGLPPGITKRVSEGVDATSSHETVSELRDYLKTQASLAPLWEKGQVLFVESELESHDTSKPVLIHVGDDASSLFRVVYTWESDVRIVRRGTREYDRISELVTAGVHTIDMPVGTTDKVDLHPRSFTFVDESGRSLAGRFGLHERDGTSFLSAWFRNVPVDNTGTVHLEDTPPLFNLYFTSDDSFYSIQRTDRHFVDNAVTSVVSILPTGTLGFSIAAYPSGHHEPLVAPCFLKVDGKYIQVSGMGICPSVGQEFVFKGLREGTYRIELKHDYKAEHVIAESEDISVRPKEHATASPFRVDEQNSR